MENFIVKPSARVYYLKIILAVLLMSFVIHLIGLTLGKDFFDIIFVVFGVGIVSCVTAYITVQFRSIEISDHDIVMKTGVINTRNVIIPYNQITNINIKRSLFDRVMKLGMIMVHTSGTDRAEMIMDYLQKKDLHRIKESLREMKVRVR